MSLELLEIKSFFEDLKILKSAISKESSKTGQINKKAILDQAEKLSTDWFGKLKPHLTSSSFEEDLISKYDTHFTHLLKLSSSKGNSKKSFLDDLNPVLLKFKDEVILILQTKGANNTSTNGELEKLLEQIQDPTKSEYLSEAINCAKANYLRAATVLGWCAAIDHIHKKIEDIGFVKFNIASVTIAGEKQGRFKRYNSPYNIQSLSELREVFDSNILWIIEFMGLIDLNQHTRLSACFDMRNHCGHPGEAPITMYNLMSFFSDINEILFKNPKFKVSQNNISEEHRNGIIENL